jgi:hypothetical protein
MRSTNLKPGDPLVLTLASDARLGPTSYVDDHIWELSLGSGEPPSLAIQTTFGMRARSFRIFPRFILQDTIHTDPATFTAPIQIKYLAPNYLRLECIPFPGINVEIEYWVPNSQTLTGRTKVANTRKESVSLILDWVALLTPDPNGQRMAPLDIGIAHLLAGKTNGLAPVLYIPGLIQLGAGPYTSLAVRLELSPHEPSAVTWIESALSTPDDSFAQAQQITSLNWDAETARIELVNTDQLEIQTGNSDWDAAFSLAQITARGLIINHTNGCHHPSTVSNRLPDQGYSLRGDGSDYTHLWDGQTLFDLYVLFDLLMPGDPDLVRGFFENFLSSQTADGNIPRKIGLAGQHGKQIAPPILATLVWRYVQLTGDKQFLHQAFPHLMSHVQSWFSTQHDRDGDGIPEWNHPIQTGFDDHPVFAHWHPWSQGWDISTVESPDLCAYLHADIQALIQMAPLVDQPDVTPGLQSLSEHLVSAVEASWDETSSTYRDWDRESHHTPSMKIIAERQGSGTIPLNTPFENPIRLLIRIRSKDETTRPAQGFIHGTGQSGGHRVERISTERFRWVLGVGRCTSERIFTHLEHVEIQGILDSDQVTIETPYLNCREQSTLLPLWAGIPSPQRAKALIKNTITNKQLFWGKFGLRACAEKPAEESAASYYQRVHPLWNSLVGEGLLRYGKRLRAAELVTRMMDAIVANLKHKHSFYSSYLATDGQGLGERNSLMGLAPLGLFLRAAGIQIINPYRVEITASNPFPWPVTVKYKGLTVIQQKKKAMIIFPDGQSITVRNDKPQLVSMK